MRPLGIILTTLFRKIKEMGEGAKHLVLHADTSRSQDQISSACNYASINTHTIATGRWES